ncbi:Uncharacterized protein SCG7109_AE_00120 [Chlamydiales bacterium SCGC AG-110-M15]|nr:Uncharacterized protein SCG7109_AE_00120 [Chlamydiales bacterium SCGC AG-110-M15]
MHRFTNLSLFFLWLLLGSSCSSNPYGFQVHKADEFVIDSYKIRDGKFSIWEMEGKIVEELPSDAMDEYKDVIHEDDILSITLYHPTRVDLVAAVKEVNSSIGFPITNGKILLPDLPPVKVEGLTLDEARMKLQEAFLDHVQDVEVFLSQKKRLERKIELTGLVATPFIPVDGRMRLFEVLSAARVPQNANFYMSYIIRDGKILHVDMHRLVREGDLTQNIVMRGGDKVYIAHQNESKVMVMGEVYRPRAIPLPSGFMSLREALVSAGGIPFTGNKKYIQVIRGNLRRPKIYVLDWHLVTHLPNNSLLLMPGDTIYVSAKPITEWNRFLSQLLPSFGGLTTMHSTAHRVGLH